MSIFVGWRTTGAPPLIFGLISFKGHLSEKNVLNEKDTPFSQKRVMVNFD